MKPIKRVSTVAAIIAMLVLAFSVYNGLRSGQVRADNVGQITASEFKLTINGEVPTADTKVKDGDPIKLQLNWTLSNMDQETRVFEMNLDELLQYIHIDDNPGGPLSDTSSAVIGTYEIKDGIFRITLNEEYVGKTSERQGGASIEGRISTNWDEDEKKNKDGQQFEIGVKNGITWTVTFDAAAPDSYFQLFKSANDSKGLYPYSDGGQLKKDYIITLSAWNNDVTDIDLSDVLDRNTGLSNMSNIKITSDSSVLSGQSYGSWAALQAALKTVTLKSGESIKITYTMDVDDDIMKKSPEKDYTNTAQATYQKANGDSGKASDQYTIQGNKPKITKTGKYKENSDNVIVWTISIDLGELNDPSDTSISETVISAIKDQACDSFTDSTVKDLLNNGTWRKDGNKWVCTYETTIKDNVVNNATRVPLTNTVTVTINGEEYKQTGTVNSNGRNWIHKEFVDYDPQDKILSWKVSLDKIPEGVTSVTVTDSTSDWVNDQGGHTLQPDVYLQVGSGEKKQIITAGAISDNAIVASYDGYSTYGNITFQDTYIKGVEGQTITLYYETKVTDPNVNGKTYQNKATLNYRDSFGGTTYTDTAVYKKETALTKKGYTGRAQDLGITVPKDEIEYLVTVDMAQIKTLTAGQDIELTDTIPKGLTLKQDSVAAALKTAYWATSLANTTVNTEVKDGKILFRIPVTADIKAQAESNPEAKIYLVYTMTLEDPVSFVKEGKEKEFTNFITGTYNGTPIGDYSTTNTLSPGQVVDKKVTYDSKTAPYAQYEIRVNPDRLDLASGMLEAVDTLGSELAYDLDSIKVEKYDPATRRWSDLATTEYKCSYSLKNNSLTFRLPDATYLRITYRARVKLPISADSTKNGSFTKEGGSNEFKLSGYTSDQSKSGKSLSGVAITPDVWAESTTGEIMIRKYWNNNDSVEALDGSTFRLLKASYDAVNKKMVDGAVVEENIAVDEKGEHKIVGLLFDQIYVLYETSAKDGYICNTEPYYFVLTGSSQITLPEDGSVDIFTSGSELFYENKPETVATGKLVITKTIQGPVTKEEAEGALRFTVKDNTTGQETVYPLSSFSYNKTADLYIKELDVPAGSYTVTESVSSINGYIKKQVTYTVDGKETSGTSAVVTVNEGGTSSIDYKDDYEVDENSGILRISKTIEGTVTKEEYEGALRFTVKNNDTEEENVYTLKDDFVYDGNEGKYVLELKPTAGGYTVTETVTDIKGYTLASVTYSVNGSAPAEGSSAAATVAKDEVTQVDFKDKYTTVSSAGDQLTEVGKLIITKTIEGPVTKEEAEGALRFTVKNNSTGTESIYTLQEFSRDAATGVYTKELDAVAGGYTVTESVSDVNGYVTQSVTYSINGATEVEGKEVAVTVAKDTTTKVDYKDRYAAVSNTGKLTITKVINGPVTKEEAEGALRFVVKNNGTQEENTYTLKDFTYDGNTDKYVLELDKAAGGYTVTETVYNVKGYVTKSVSYTVNGGDSQKAKAADVDVAKDNTSTVAFKDNYQKKASTQDTDTGNDTKEKKEKQEKQKKQKKSKKKKVNTTENEEKTGSKVSSSRDTGTVDTADKVYPMLIVSMILLLAADLGIFLICRKKRKLATVKDCRNSKK